MISDSFSSLRMNMELRLPFPSLYPVLRSGLLASDHIYLVGGVVRDMMLHQEPHDIDVVVQTTSDRVKGIARKIANHFHGGMYVLDEERHTYRVFAQDLDDKEWKIDIALVRGSALDEDLWLRDFTINAIAVDVTKEDGICLFDPTGGVHDLTERVLKPVTLNSLDDDSIRILRGIRMSLEFHLRIDDGVSDLMKNAVCGLKTISGERFRDELFRLLSTPYAQKGLDLFFQLSVFETLFGKTHTSLNLHQSHILHGLDCWSESNPCWGGCSCKFQHFFSGFEKEAFDYLTGCNSSGRSRLSLLKLTCLFLNGVDYADMIEYFALSQQEQTFIVTILKNIKKFHFDVKHKELWDKRDVYRFYQATHDAGPAICFMTLAEGYVDHDELDSSFIGVCRTLLTSYFISFKTIIQPDPLLNGYDLMALFNISAGPKIGLLIEMLKEAQATGLVRNRDEAILYLKDAFSANDESRSMGPDLEL